MAPGCTNYHGKNKSVQYHHFPVDDKDLGQKWLRVMKLASPPKLENARVCSLHFTDDDYEPGGKLDKDGNVVLIRRHRFRRETAVPSLIDFSSYSIGSTDAPTVSTQQVSERAGRAAKRSDKKVAREIN